MAFSKELEARLGDESKWKKTMYVHVYDGEIGMIEMDHGDDPIRAVVFHYREIDDSAHPEFGIPIRQRIIPVHTEDLTPQVRSGVEYERPEEVYESPLDAILEHMQRDYDHFLRVIQRAGNRDPKARSIISQATIARWKERLIGHVEMAIDAAIDS